MPKHRSVKLINVDVCMKLIEMVREIPAIYDAKSPDHMNAAFIANAWKSIAKELNIPGLSGEDVKVRWRTMRDSYVRKKKEIAKNKSASGARFPVRWKYMDILGFLDPFIQEARNCVFEDDITPCPSPDPSTCNSSDIISRTTTSNTIASTSFVISPRVSQKYRKKNRNERTNFEATFGDGDLAKAQSSRREHHHKEDRSRTAMDAFFESCAIRAKELPKPKQSWLQMQVSMLLYAVETKEVQELAETESDSGMTSIV